MSSHRDVAPMGWSVWGTAGLGRRAVRWGLVLVAWCAVFVAGAGAAPDTFAEAKVALRQQVYFDRNQTEFGDLYCGCTWRWQGRSGGRMDLASCGYEAGRQPQRARRVEYEHIVPAWTFGHQRQCWQHGGRKRCEATDAVFRRMEADMHNLSPTIGEVNADRSHWPFGMVAQAPRQYGACETRVDRRQRVVEPRDAVKGLVARISFYMSDRYGLTLSRQQQQLFMAWHRQFPASGWEIERDRRIARIMGHHNPFVTGEREWTLGYRSSRDGVSAADSAKGRPVGPPSIGHSNPGNTVGPGNTAGAVIGNANSRVYHLPTGCPGYGSIAPRNQRRFESESAAKAAGFRKAGNCR